MRFVAKRADFIAGCNDQHICGEALLPEQIQAFEDGAARHGLGRKEDDMRGFASTHGLERGIHGRNRLAGTGRRLHVKALIRVNGVGDGIHDALLANARVEGKLKGGKGALSQLIMTDPPRGPALCGVEKGEEPYFDIGDVSHAFDLTDLTGGHARVRDSDIDLL